MTLHCNYHAKPGTIVLAFHTSLRLSLRESLAGGLPPDQKNHIGCGVPVGYVPRVWLHVRSSAGMPYPSLHQTWWVTGQALCSFHPGPCHCIERERGARKTSARSQQPLPVISYHTGTTFSIWIIKGGKQFWSYVPLQIDNNPFPLLLNVPQILKTIGSISNFGKFQIGQFDF